MQTSMPLEKTMEFFGRLLDNAGKISHKVFNSYQTPYALYNIDFEKGKFLVSISINAKSKINGFSV